MAKGSLKKKKATAKGKIMGLGNNRREEYVEKAKPWGNMHSNLLSKIFICLTSVELFFTVSLVCLSWRSTCFEVLLWKDYQTLDLTNLKSLVRFTCSDIMPCEIDKPWSTYPQRLINALECLLLDTLVLERCVTAVIIPRNMYISGLEDLTFVAKRSQSLRTLVLQDAYALKDGCFSEALKHWKLMEEMSIGPVYNRIMNHIIRELGTKCKNFKTLNVSLWGKDYYNLDLYNATLIAKHLQLKEFSMSGGSVDKNGVSRILSQCKQLSKFNLKSCYIGVPKNLNDNNNNKDTKVSVNMKKKIIGRESFKWSLDSKTSLVGRDEVLDHLFQDLS